MFGQIWGGNQNERNMFNVKLNERYWIFLENNIKFRLVFSGFVFEPLRCGTSENQ